MASIGGINGHPSCCAPAQQVPDLKQLVLHPTFPAAPEWRIKLFPILMFLVWCNFPDVAADSASSALAAGQRQYSTSSHSCMHLALSAWC